MVEDVAKFRARPGDTPAHRGAFFGGRAHRPVEEVEVLDVLLDDEIAQEPGDEEPAAKLPFEVGPFVAAHRLLLPPVGEGVAVAQDLPPVMLPIAP